MIYEMLIDKKHPGTVVCGYRKVPATDRLTGFATAAPRTPERTRVTGRARLLAFDGAEETPSDSVVDAIMARQALGVAWLSSVEKDSDRQR